MTEQISEFSRLVCVANLPEGGKRLEILATPAECEALAERYSVPAVEQLSACVELRRLGGGKGGVRVALTGSLRARVKQICVVSLEAMKTQIEAEFGVDYGPQKEAQLLDLDRRGAMDEPLIGDSIDVGEAVAEQLALEIPQFPRMEGASLRDPASSSASTETPKKSDSAFSVLEKLGKKG